MASPFAKNAVFESDIGLHRALHVSAESNEVVIYDLKSKNAWPKWRYLSDIVEQVKQAKLGLVDDPYRPLIRPDLHLNQTEKNTRDIRVAAIRPIVEDRRLLVFSLPLTKVVSIIHGGHPPSCVNSFAKWLRRYWEWGQVANALVPDYSNCGHPIEPRVVTKKLGRRRAGNGEERTAGINVTPEIAEKLQSGAVYIYAGYTYHEAYLKTSVVHWGKVTIVDGVSYEELLPQNERPTFEQFVYWVGKVINRTQRLIGQVGQSNFDLQHRSRTGSAKVDVPGPGTVYQIDSTVADIYLRSLLSPTHVVGRPTVYIVVDHYSGMIVGLWVSLRPASVEGAKQALRVALMPKSLFCRMFGIEIEDSDWPADSMFFELLTDRGPEFTSKVLQAISNVWGTRHALAALRRGDWKGMVEGRFNWLNDEVIHWEPGTTHERRPGSPTCPDDCVHTIVSFWKLLILAVLKHNNRRIEELPPGYTIAHGYSPTAREVFNNGFRLEGARRRADPVLVDTCLMPSVEARLSNRGIYVPGGRIYRCVSGIDRDWYVREPSRSYGTIRVFGEDYDIGKAQIWLQEHKRFEQLELIPAQQFFNGWSLDEYDDYMAWRRAGDRRLIDDDLATNFAIEYQMKKVKAQATAELALAGGVTKAHNLRADRDREINIVEQSLGFPGRQVALNSPTSIPSSEPPHADYTHISAPDHAELLNDLAEPGK